MDEINGCQFACVTSAEIQPFRLVHVPVADFLSDKTMALMLLGAEGFHLPKVVHGQGRTISCAKNLSNEFFAALRCTVEQVSPAESVRRGGDEVTLRIPQFRLCRILHHLTPIVTARLETRECENDCEGSEPEP